MSCRVSGELSVGEGRANNCIRLQAGFTFVARKYSQGIASVAVVSIALWNRNCANRPCAVPPVRPPQSNDGLFGPWVSGQVVLVELELRHPKLSTRSNATGVRKFLLLCSLPELSRYFTVHRVRSGGM